VFGNSSGAVVSQRQLGERLERDRLQRHRTSAQARLRLLDPSVRVRPSNLHDTGGTIDVAVLEREQLGGSKPGRGREHDHRPEHRPEVIGERPDLRPGIERPLLPAAPARIRDSVLGRVLLDQLPRNRPIQHLPQRLGRLEAVPFRNGQPPRTDLLRRELDKAHITQRGGRLAERPAQLRDRDPFTLMRIQVLLDPLPERQRCRTAAGQEPRELVVKRPLRLSLAADPPTCSRAEPRPAMR
jgi:hypothetical protein